MREQLQQRRRAKLTEARAILDKAQRANRSLTVDEKRAYDLVTDEVRDLQNQIESMAPESQRVAPAGGFDDDRRWRDVRARSLRSKDRLVDYMVARGEMPPQTERASFGEIVRAIATGDQRQLNDTERRALAASTGTAGGFMAPSPVATDVLDFARAQSKVIAAGALTVPMNAGSLTLAKITDGIEPAWKAENEEGAESDAAFGEVILTAKTLHVHCSVGLELIEDAPNASDVIEREFTAAVASEFDRCALLGSGLVNQPRGLAYWGGVNARALGAGNGATPADYDFLIDAIGDVWTGHGVPSAILYSSRTAVTLAKLKEAVNLQPLRIPKTVEDVPRLVTNQIPNTFTVGGSADCSKAFTGDFRMLAIGIRIGFQFEVSRTAGDAFKKGQVMVRGRLRGDIGVLRANQFTVTSGIRG